MLFRRMTHWIRKLFHRKVEISFSCWRLLLMGFSLSCGVFMVELLRANENG